MFSYRHAISLSVVASSLAFITAPARADDVISADWGFSAAFPCQAQIKTKPINTDAGNVTMVYYICQNGGSGYYVALGDYPKGFVISPDETLASAAQGAAQNVNGTIRSMVPYPIGNIPGRELLVDVTSSSAVAHVRIFVVGDRLYQVGVLGRTGSERSQAWLDFLNSFTLRH